jgi:hypothetical protein
MYSIELRALKAIASSFATAGETFDAIVNFFGHFLGLAHPRSIASGGLTGSSKMAVALTKGPSRLENSIRGLSPGRHWKLTVEDVGVLRSDKEQ